MYEEKSTKRAETEQNRANHRRNTRRDRGKTETEEEIGRIDEELK